MKDGVENSGSAFDDGDELDGLVRILRSVAAELGGDGSGEHDDTVPIERSLRGDAVEMRMLVPGRVLTTVELRAAFAPEADGGASPVTAALASCRDLVTRRGGVFCVENTDEGVQITLEVARPQRDGMNG